MASTSHESILNTRVRMPWKHGPSSGFAGPLLLSYTEFTPDSLGDWPEIVRVAMRLRKLWPQLLGAVGMTLYLQPLRGRAGSLSAWESEEALRCFVGLPYHVQIMRKYRTRGDLRSASWRAERLDVSRALTHGLQALDGTRAQAPEGADG
ncbi:MAG TPA: hypothetical protein VFV03_01635 [Solirubrobacteraceae bacterium]|nr:hypothetical protein [Solirubrobacteraceae bacterium]